MMVQLMRSSGVTVVFAALSPAIKALLIVHGVIRGHGKEGILVILVTVVQLHITVCF
jgi:hypothetical protein